MTVFCAQVSLCDSIYDCHPIPHLDGAQWSFTQVFFQTVTCHPAFLWTSRVFLIEGIKAWDICRVGECESVMCDQGRGTFNLSTYVIDVLI